MKYVVDTNVPIVCNGQTEQASYGCVEKCKEKIEEIRNSGVLILDSNWLIIREYMRKLHSSGEPGIGDAFLKWVLTNYTNENRCELVSITPIGPESLDFEEFPSNLELRGFDPDDRKFVAVAIAHNDNPTILQAVDCQWWEMRDGLLSIGLDINFLCIDDIERILGDK